MNMRLPHTQCFRRATIALLPVVVLLASCASPVNRGLGESSTLVPGEFSAAANGEAVPDRWWTAFGSEELNALVQRALDGSTSLAQAEARFRQASALAAQRGAARIPEVSANASGRITERETAATPEGDTRTESWELNLAASYELDLWGRVRAGAKSAALDRDASREDLQAARISVAAEITLRYFDLLTTRRKIDIVAGQLGISRKVEEVVETRYRRSMASGLDLLRQRENVAAIEAQQPPLVATEKLLLNELAVLAGQAPGADLGLEARTLPVLAPAPSTGLPAALLARRPDVRAAVLRADSAGFSLSAAKRDRLPAIRLTASAGYTSEKLADLIDNWIAQLAASLVAPLIDGGRRRAEVIRTRGVLDERLASYKGVVLRALRDVEDALVLEQGKADQLAALERQLEAARRSQERARDRYLNGAESYLSVLAAITNVQGLERRIADTVNERAAARVRLYRSLAGAWDDTETNKKAKP